jgi:predicted enzyme related to lactoylglutathione lyase
MTVKAHAVGLVLDCHDPRRLARFWAAALDYVVIGSAGSYVMLLPAGRPGLKLLLQRVPEAKSVKNRMHMDIHTVDIEAEASRLEQLGARRAQPDPLREHGTSWILMTDPEGNEFCVCDGGPGEPWLRRAAGLVALTRRARSGLARGWTLGRSLLRPGR